MEKTGKDFWGPPIWTTIHILGACFRPENAEAFKTMLRSLAEQLPCDYCADNLRKKMRMIPPDKYLTNRHDAFYYTYLLHDLANQHISKHTGIVKISPPYEEVKAYYFQSLGDDCMECKV